MNSCERSRLEAEARGYLGELDWLEKMNKKYEQTKCKKCGLFHIFKKPELSNNNSIVRNKEE